MSSHPPKLTEATFEQLPMSAHQSLFLVDYHLSVPLPYGHKFPEAKCYQSTIIMNVPSGIKAKRFKYCWYKVGGFDQVWVVWPLKWKCPGSNAYGWLPKLEFGDPAFPPYYTSINPHQPEAVAPFRYVDCDGEWYEPTEPG